METVQFTAETSSNGVIERDFALGEITGVLWSPASGSDHVPLVLMGHGGGQHKKTPALVARARNAVTSWGFTVVAIDAPGHGDRPRTAVDDQARDDLRQAMQEGDSAGVSSVSVRYGIALAERAVQFLLPWDDEHVDRQSALALFDAFASPEKTLHANPGDHRSIRWIGLDNEFLPRHLGPRAS
jgi:fermentation-respiration switch protein FrsA (DUF1100 family)